MLNQLYWLYISSISIILTVVIPVIYCHLGRLVVLLSLSLLERLRKSITPDVHKVTEFTRAPPKDGWATADGV